MLFDDELDLRGDDADQRGDDSAADVPEAWKTFEDGTPQPNWVALLHESRQAR